MESTTWIDQFNARDTRGQATEDDYARMSAHIAASCRRIRAGWSRSERYLRRTGLTWKRRAGVTAPVVRVEELKTAK